MKYTLIEYMCRALGLAERGRGRVGTNPLVGCVVARGRRVVGEGWHARYGCPHAEAIALSRAGEKSRGADLYVTMEPCSRTGKTPPCTRMIVAAGVKRVIYACRDPKENGDGLKELRRNGIGVTGGIMDRESREQNVEYFTRIGTCRPFVTLKLAMTLDGRMADDAGRSKWITSDKARAWTRVLRNKVDAVMVGVGTVLADDPRLTPPGGGNQPLKIIVDSRARTPVSARLLRTGKTLIVTGSDAPKDRTDALRARDAEIIQVGTGKGKVMLRKMMKALFARGIGSILCEGGATLGGALITEGMVDRMVMVIAPKLMGNLPVGGTLNMRGVEIIRIGPDVAVQAGRIM